MEKGKNYKLLFFVGVIFGLFSLSIIATDTIAAASTNDFNYEVLDLVNKERIKNNLEPLKMDKDLQKAAAIRSKEIVKLVDHVRPDGSSWYTVSKKTYGENIASGQKTAKEVVEDWMNSPGHRANILNPNYKTIGIAVYIDPNTYYKKYWVQEFGIGNLTPSSYDKGTLSTKISGVLISSLSSKGIKVNWNKISPKNSDGYQIYKYNSKTKKYNLFKTINSSQKSYFVYNSLKSLKKYKFKIRSFKKINNTFIYGSFKELSFYAPPNVPKIRAYYMKKGSIKKLVISWKKTPKVSGYVIYRLKNDEDYIKPYVKLSKSYVTGYSESFPSKGNYTYVIKTYKIKNGKKIYSKFSNFVTFKV